MALSEQPVVLLDPRTCGLQKKGETRYRVNPITGARLEEIDDELNQQVEEFLRGQLPEGAARVPWNVAANQKVLVPRYYDPRWTQGFEDLLEGNDLTAV